MSSLSIQTDIYSDGGGGGGVPSSILPTGDSFPIALADATLTILTPLWCSIFWQYDSSCSEVIFDIPNPSGSSLTYDLVLMQEGASPKNLLCLRKQSITLPLGSVGFFSVFWATPVPLFKGVVYWVGIQELTGSIQVAGATGKMNPNVAGAIGGQSLAGAGNLNAYVPNVTTIPQNSRPNTAQRNWFRLQ